MNNAPCMDILFCFWARAWTWPFPEIVPNHMSACRKFHHIGNDKRACDFRTMSFVADLASKVLTRVNWWWRNRRLVIAFHPPIALLESGLLVCPPEKNLENTAPAVEWSFLCRPLC